MSVAWENPNGSLSRPRCDAREVWSWLCECVESVAISLIGSRPRLGNDESSASARAGADREDLSMRRMTRAVVLALCSIGVAASTLVAPVPGHTDDGCPTGLVPRNTRPGDTVCVTPQVATEVAQENANAASTRQPGGGAYGPLTCKPGLVWREAFVGDAVCVAPDRRTESKAETAAEMSKPPSAPPSNGGPGGPRPAPGPGPPPRPASKSPASPACDPKVDICVG
jgi:hypothetical protein